MDIIGNIIFSCNSAGDHGGGVHAEENSNVTISGNTTTQLVMVEDSGHGTVAI